MIERTTTKLRINFKDRDMVMSSTIHIIIPDMGRIRSRMNHMS
jgi:hypothetical protein